MSINDRSKVGKGDFLKAFEDVHIPDVRWQIRTNSKQAFEDFHSRIEGIRLSDQVPNDIFIHFETAKNTLAYSYFSYRLSMPAMMVALATLELAITRKAELISYDGKMRGLNTKLKTAFSHKWIDIKNVAAPTNVPSNISAWKEYTEKAFIPYFKELRNSLMHELGVLGFPWDACRDLETVSKMINELFEARV